MRAMTLNKAFFDRNSFLVAQELIGCSLCRKFSDQTTLKSTISEIECMDLLEGFIYTCATEGIGCSIYLLSVRIILQLY